jgi:hypothetical protein
VTIKPESCEKIVESPIDLYPQSSKVLEPEMTVLQIPPTVQQPIENSSSDSLSLSQRKQPRVGKSMERERQHQQHITMNLVEEVPQFKQEFSVKKEGEVKKEKNCEEVESFRVKVEEPEVVAPKESETVTVNLTTESSDECVDYSTKRKVDTSDVIELSDNSTVDPPSTAQKRRKLLEIPVNAPKKSPPNSYKSLIKQSSQANYTATSSKAKLISSTRLGKTSIKRRSILKSKSSVQKLRLAKAKKRAMKKKIEEKAEEIVEEIKPEVSEKSETSTEDKSMDSDNSGKSNIDETIDRVAKGYFSEPDIFSVLSKQRKTKSQKKFDKKLLKAEKLRKIAEKTKKKSKVNKDADDGEIHKASKPKKSVDKKKAKKPVEIEEKDPLALDEIPSSHSTPKRKPKATKKTKKAKEVAEEPLAVVESDEDDKTIETLETRDEETSTTVLSSVQTSKSTLDETDVANNNNEFEDNNRHKQESLTLYKTPGVGWTTYNKPGKKGKKAKAKKHRLTLNDIVIPKR